MSTVEWSGVLFYTTEGGNFGDPTFKVVAQELFLMDIDTPAFTSYKFDGTFVGMLMKNPHLRAMKLGHIHSHNSMSVFFSGTDTTEINDNSKLHNYYVSLIVNNKNEMVAKVAFRATNTMINSTKLSYKDINGVPIDKFTFKEDIENLIFVYDCDIIKPYNPSANFMERYREIRDSKKSANDLIRKQAGEQRTSKDITFIDFDLPQSDTIDGQKINNYTPGIKAGIQSVEELKNQYKNATKAQAMRPVQMPKNIVPGQLFDQTESEVATGSNVEGELRDYMIAILGNGVQNQMLSQVLGNLNLAMTNPNFSINAHIYSTFENYLELYGRFFKDDPFLKRLDERIRTARRMFNNQYSEKYPELVKLIIQKLNTL